MACGHHTGIRVGIPLLTRDLNLLVTADLNCGLNAVLRPELVRRFNAVLKLAQGAKRRRRGQRPVSERHGCRMALKESALCGTGQNGHNVSIIGGFGAEGGGEI